jgi:hypothetical protein
LFNAAKKRMILAPGKRFAHEHSSNLVYAVSTGTGMICFEILPDFISSNPQNESKKALGCIGPMVARERL